MSSRSNEPSPCIPRTLGGRYRLESVTTYEIGATVYRARDARARRDVLVIVPDDESVGGDPELSGSRASLLRHPGLTNVLDTNRPGERPYLVVEMPAGKSLGRIVAERGRYSPGDFAAIGSQILLAIAHLHELGLVHRNLHSDNVYVLGDDPRTARVKIAGVHACVRDRESPDTTRVLPRNDVRTRDPRWRPDDHADARDDVFELGLLFKDAIDLTGPEHDPEGPTRRRLLSLCNRCMAPAKMTRPANAQELLESFLECYPRGGSRATALRPSRTDNAATDLSERLIHGRRQGWWLPGGRWIGAVVAGAASACMLLLLPPRACQPDAVAVAVPDTASLPSAASSTAAGPSPGVQPTAPPVVEPAAVVLSPAKDAKFAAAPTDGKCRTAGVPEGAAATAEARGPEAALPSAAAPPTDAAMAPRTATSPAAVAIASPTPAVALADASRPAGSATPLSLARELGATLEEQEAEIGPELAADAQTEDDDDDRAAKQRRIRARRRAAARRRQQAQPRRDDARERAEARDDRKRGVFMGVGR